MYVVPLGYLSGDYSMLISVFVLILVGTLVGLAMLATAIQPAIERLLIVRAFKIFFLLNMSSFTKLSNYYCIATTFLI